MAATLEAAGIDPGPIIDAIQAGRQIKEAITTLNAGQQVSRIRSSFVRQMLEAEAAWRSQVADINAGTIALDVDIVPGTFTGFPFSAPDVSPTLSKSQLRQKALKELEEKWHKLIQKGWTESFRLGHAVRTGEAPLRMPADVQARIDGQKKFASQFARDVASGLPSKPGRMSVGNRAGLYGNSLTGAFNAGAVAGGDVGELIFWRLGATDHCPDCPVLALMSPYTRATLPTIPRAGETVCRMNCACFLEFIRPGGATRVTPDEMQVPAVDAIIKPPKPPKGMRLPTEAESKVIADLEARLNYARRQIAKTAGTPAQAKWIAARRQANSNLIDMLDERRIWSPPKLSVGEVINGRQVPAPTVRDLTTVRGVDGRTVNRGDAAKRAQALTAQQAAVNKRAATFAPEGPLGEIEDLQAMLIRAGAPAELFSVVGEDVGDVDATILIVLNSFGFGAGATLRQHMTALDVMGAEVYDVEVGPYGDDWLELVPSLGTWISGDPESVRKFTAAWVDAVDTKGPPAMAQWRL